MNFNSSASFRGCSAELGVLVARSPGQRSGEGFSIRFKAGSFACVERRQHVLVHGGVGRLLRAVAKRQLVTC